MIYFKINSIVYSTGFAIFAVFFGCGNVIFSIQTGILETNNIFISIFGFFITSVIIPFLGFYSCILYNCNYRLFFSTLGKIPSFLLITFLIIMIGPLFAMPRTEVISYGSIVSYLPCVLKDKSFFCFFYCILVFFFTYSQVKIINILGNILSPIKIFPFLILIFFEFFFSEKNNFLILNNDVFKDSVFFGYGSMDLLGTFFLCSVLYNSFFLSLRSSLSIIEINKMFIFSCFFGYFIISVVYIFIILISHNHIYDLKYIIPEMHISVLSVLILDNFLGTIVNICVSISCLATVIALADVTADYIYKDVLNERVPRVFCLLFIILLTFLMSNFDFNFIVYLASPILNIIYPTLIVLSVFNVIYKITGFNIVKISFYFTILLCFIYSFIC